MSHREGEVELRCGDGRPCGEVLDRLLAADRSYAAGEYEAAAMLRESASRWADAHGRGSTPAGQVEEGAA